MVTDLGEIKILVNEREVSYDCVELTNYIRYFKVKKRYKLICKIPETLKENIQIKCIITLKENVKVMSGPETGENLALISFWWHNSKLSIGTVGDIEGVQYNYLENAMELKMRENPEQVAFYVAWIDMIDEEKEDIYTWFAADPAYDV
ncbi:MAG: hypothetical protein HDR19_02570 [Lachnospiraceae bacterium]|nr:hypothetical protein [Lachnospiraceae bacterium]